MERRAHTRYEIHDPVCITVLPETAGGSESETFNARTDDLSERGLRFAADVPFRQGQLLNLLVVRGCAYWGFSFKARVIWVRTIPKKTRVFVGVEFIEVPEATHMAWKELIERAWEYRAPAEPAAIVRRRARRRVR